MNRLILIGNGFDLAHKMETSYNHFILWYLEERINKALSNEYEDELLRVYPETASKAYINFSNLDLKEIIRHFHINNMLNDFLFNRKIMNLNSSLRFTFKSSFLQKLMIDFSLLNWVDIENRYYEELKGMLNHTKRNEALNELNNEFEIIIQNLKRYLQTIQPIKNGNITQRLNQIISNRINIEEISILKDCAIQKNQIPKSVLFLNFNYTSTIENCTFFHSDEPLKVNYIHGKLEDDKNPIIFGFGDELDKEYSLIEQEKTKGFFKYFKSFGYFNTSNYHDLIRFIESDEFQIYIFGHSCGLSDRTMLNMVFEHENCKTIKIYFHQREDGSDNYTELTEEISRHFKDKGLMRKKIVSKDKSEPLPQMK